MFTILSLLWEQHSDDDVQQREKMTDVLVLLFAGADHNCNLLLVFLHSFLFSALHFETKKGKKLENGKLLRDSKNG